LLEPEIGHIRRVHRLQVLRYQSGIEGQRAAQADGIPPEEYRLCSETEAQIEEYSRALNLALPRQSGGRAYICGDEKLPSATALVRGLFDKVDVPSVYNLYSGYSHGQLFALGREFEPVTSDHGIHYRLVTNEQSFKGAVAVASYALYPSASRRSSSSEVGSMCRR
jgi:hypothetical protein